MSTKQTTTSNSNQQQTSNQSQQFNGNQSYGNNYNQAGMNTYNSLIPQFGSAVSDMISNPFNNPTFNTANAMSNSFLGSQNAGQIRTLGNNFAQFGGASSPAFASQLAQQNRAFSGQQAGAFNNNLMNAWNQRTQALGMAGNFNPLATGGFNNQSGSSSGNAFSSGNSNSNQVQQTSGLGSWLTPLLSAGLGGLMGGLGGRGGGATPLSNWGQGSSSGTPTNSNGGSTFNDPWGGNLFHF